jgi:hypothetical protein
MKRDEMQARIDLLRQENDRLRLSVSVLVEDFVGMREEKATLLDENAQLRAAIDRVRALHTRKYAALRWDHVPVCTKCKNDSGEYADHPCSTLRALDGEGA